MERWSNCKMWRFCHDLQGYCYFRTKTILTALENKEHLREKVQVGLKFQIVPTCITRWQIMQNGWKIRSVSKFIFKREPILELTQWLRFTSFRSSNACSKNVFPWSYWVCNSSRSRSSNSDWCTQCPWLVLVPLKHCSNIEGVIRRSRRFASITAVATDLWGSVMV